jgi:hypothetical protein
MGMYKKTTTITYKWDEGEEDWVEESKTVDIQEDAEAVEHNKNYWPTDWTEGWSLPEGPTCEKVPPDSEFHPNKYEITAWDEDEFVARKKFQDSGG